MARWTCRAGCGDDLIELGSLEDVTEHLRVFHPDLYDEGIQRWPDGGIVVEDHALEPGEFHDPT